MIFIFVFLFLGNFQVGPNRQIVKSINESGFEEVSMMKHISYIATSVDDAETGKTKTVRSADFKRMAYWIEESPEYK